jgi:protein ImuA
MEKPEMSGSLEHRAEKWEPVFRPSDAAPTRLEHRAEKWEPVFRPSDAAPVDLEYLRTVVGALETAHAAPACLPLGVAGLDGALGGGIAVNGVTQLMPATALDEAPALHCALVMAGQLLATRQGDLVIVADPAQTSQWGMIHARGLAMLGIDPARVLLVRPHTAGDVRACVEEAARSAGIGAVLGWLSEKSGFELVPARRVQLAAEEAVTPVLLSCALRTAPFAPARARLSVSPRPGPVPDWVRLLAPDISLPPPGDPAWTVEIIRARSGGRGRFALEFDHASHRLRDPAPMGDRAAHPRAEEPIRPAVYRAG